MIRPLIALLIFIPLASASASSSKDDDDTSTNNSPAPVTLNLGSGQIIIDNTANDGVPAVMTNLRTGVAGSSCNKSDALISVTCNSFSTPDIKVLQKNSQGNLVAEIGVNNSRSTKYNNAGTPSAATFFTGSEDDHLFDLNQLRKAADWLKARPTSAPAGTYGTISWQQFISNVAQGRTMYGLVRVKVPLSLEPQQSLVNNATKSPFIKVSSSSDDGDDDGDSRNKRKFCLPEKVNQVSPCGCAPVRGTALTPGETLCGIKLTEKSKIDVRGSIMWDFVECTTEEEPIPISLLPSSPRELYIEVNVPITVNPANPDSNGALRDLPEIAKISANAACGADNNCSVNLSPIIPYSSIPDESKNQFLVNTGKHLSSERFGAMGTAEQFSLRLPSGYVKGWYEAFSILGLTAEEWASQFPALDTKTIKGQFSEDDIRSDAFVDLPVYLYSGGLIDMHHIVNISGLVYVPQALELEQKGLLVTTTTTQPNKPKSKDDDDSDDDDKNDDDSRSSSLNISNNYFIKTSSSSKRSSSDDGSDDGDDGSDDGDDDDKKESVSCGQRASSNDDSSDDGDRKSMAPSRSNDDGSDDGDDSSDDGDDGDDGDDDDVKIIKECPEAATRFTPASQYIRGAIIVRDAFYIESGRGGTTILSNDPNSYSQIRVAPNKNGTLAFEPLARKTRNNVPDGNTGGNGDRNGDPNSDGDQGSPGNNNGNPGTPNNPAVPGQTGSNLNGIPNGPLWVEIRAQ